MLLHQHFDNIFPEKSTQTFTIFPIIFEHIFQFLLLNVKIITKVQKTA